jgi:Pyridoxamine 5'-phosphate oxidase
VLSTVTPGGYEHLDCLASKYAAHPVRFFGDAIPVSFAATETPVLCRIRPAHAVALDATGSTRRSWQRHDQTADPVRPAVDGQCALVNTTLERQKGRNLVDNHKVSLLVVDPANTSRFIQIRGDAELVRKGAHEHLDALTRKYTGHATYYGYLYPEAQRLRETRVICRVHPRRITLDAIHSADH